MPKALSADLFAQYLRISRLLAGQLDFQSAIDAVAKEIKDIVPNDHMDVCIIAPGSTFHTAYESGIETDWSRRPPASIDHSPLRSLLRGEVDRIVTDDASTDPQFHFEGSFSFPIIEHKLKSRLHVALKVHGETIGALSCSSLRTGVYGQGDLDRASAIGDLIAPYFYALLSAERAKKSAIVEAETRVREEALRQGAGRLTEALEAERQRIGMELHDQTLADMTRFARRLERLSLMPDLPGEMLEPLTRSLQQSMRDLRQIIEQARPSVLQLFGPAEAIENHLERSIRDSGMSIEWELLDETDGASAELPQAVSVAIYRIAQEAINNAIRHSQGDRVDVRLWKDKGVVVLDIRDNGIGMTTPPGPRGSGIDNMRTRARLISAQFACRSDGSGTTVSVRLPRLEQGVKI
ncbi:ATP-binding protein [Ciceribacter sp. L1K22]|uniref:GAF domain-containing sensor histidine kinase n=1 Tax=Ciceribacter sp. L1K22 TaxID=2820275 RepID=UPI001ABEA803|nr:GAF domain-containing sensor histidine kinase [Ciceribacter sp. L1K22]